MKLLSKARGTLARVLGVVVVGALVGILVALACYLMFLHLLGVALVCIRDQRSKEPRYVHWREYQFRMGFFVSMLIVVLSVLLFVAHAIGGWWLAGPMAALAAYVVQADLRQPVVRS